MASEGTMELKEPRRAMVTPWWERNLPWLLIAPSVIFLVLFSFIPAITTISYAFSRVRMARGGDVGGHRDRLAGGVCRVHGDLHVQHGGQLAQRPCRR